MKLVIYSILLALEVSILAVLVSNAIPFAHNPVWDTILAREQGNISPKRDLQIYGLFLLLCLGIYALAVILYRQRSQNSQWQQKLNHWLLAQGTWVFIEIYAAFKIVMDNEPSWARGMLYGSLILSFFTKIFWSPLSVFIKKGWRPIERWVPLVFSGWGANAMAVLFIVGVIAITDPQAVVAQLYMGDQFHTWDFSCLGTVYGMFNGLLPDVDVYSMYGFGIPILLTGMMKVLGGFDYVNVIKALVALGIIYYVAWFFILRQWFTSGWLALTAILLGMRVAMFPMFVIPSIWNAVAESVLRFCFDALFFWFLYKHVTTNRKIYLWLSAAAAGLGMYHMISTGAGLFFALLAYIGIHCAVPHIRSKMIHSRWDYLSLARLIFFTPIFTMVLIGLTVKGNILSPVFWNHVLEFHLLYANGYSSHSLMGALQRKDFEFAVIGLGLVLFYVESLLYAIHLVYFKKADYKIVFAIPLAVYGFCMHAYYIETANPYCTFTLPSIFLLFFWIDHACQRLSPLRQKQIYAGMFLGSCFLLISSPMFTAYPNVFNLSRNPIVDPNVAIKLDNGGFYFNQLYIGFPESLKLPLNSLGEKDENLKYEKDFKTDQELVDFYKKDTDFSQDADLIRRLTPEGARVPLISSFEILMLSQAQRKPFFYYFPYLSSRLMRTRSFVTSTILTRTQLATMIGQLEQDKPEYVFMQRIFLTPQVPMWYGYQFEDCIDLIRYVEAHYQPEQIGKFLVAMKRK